MNQRQFAAVLFAATGVFLIASAVSGAVSYFVFLVQLDPAVEDAGPISQRSMAVVGIGSSAFIALLASGLIWARNRLAAWLFAAESAALPDAQIQAVAFSVLGCYLAATGLAGFLPAALVPDGWFVWGEATKALLGVAIFFGARGLSGLWTQLRGRGPGVQPDDRIA